MDPNTPSGPSTRSKLDAPNKGSHLDALHRSGESRGNVAGSFVFKGLFWGGRNQEPNNRCRVGGVLKNTVFLSFDIVALGGVQVGLGKHDS